MTSPNQTSAQRTYQLGLLVAVGLLLCLPSLGYLLRAHDELVAILRGPGDLFARGKKLRTTFGEGFAGRGRLLTANARLQAQWLGSSTNAKVLVGRDGWLYLADEKGVEDYRRLEPYSDDDLDKWQHYLERLHSWCKRHHARFLFVIAPNKPTIYPEHLPSWVPPSQLPFSSRQDQLLDRLRDRTDIPFVDVRPSLLAAKGHEQLYYATDTHWNQLGMFVAYQQLAQPISAWFGRFPIPARSDFVLSRRATSDGDLARMVGLANGYQESLPLLSPKLPRCAAGLPASEPRIGMPYIAERHSTCPGAPIGKLLLLHDSFFSSMLPLLAEHAEVASYRWEYQVADSLLDREQPDLLILEIIERVLMRPPPT